MDNCQSELLRLEDTGKSLSTYCKKKTGESKENLQMEIGLIGLLDLAIIVDIQQIAVAFNFWAEIVQTLHHVGQVYLALEITMKNYPVAVL